jgi:hypothetical protein
MNYQKLDAALSMALNEVKNPESPSLAVFIHVQSISTAEATAILQRLGAGNVDGSYEIITATLSANGISALSEESWVKYLRLSQVLYPLDRRP